MVFSETQKESFARLNSAKAYGALVLFFALCKRTIIKSQLLPILYVFDSIKSYLIFAVADYWNSPTVWVTAVGESTGKISLNNGVYYEDFSPIRFLFVFFNQNVVKINVVVLFEFFELLILVGFDFDEKIFDHVLLNSPIPAWINLPIIYCN